MPTAPSFWWRRRPTWTARLLWLPSIVYGLVARWRFRPRGGARASIPVICIGNPTVGGAGKTPTAIAIASHLAERGQRPVFLSRGYGGTLRGPIVLDPTIHTAKQVGDEPLLLARYAPVVISADRAAGAALATTHGDMIVMDDGFQNPSLFKDLSILVIDGEVGVGNGLCLPAGPLRLAFKPQLAAADALLVVGEDRSDIGAAIKRLEAVCLEGAITGAAPAALRQRPIIAYCGIGRPQKFFDTLSKAGLNLSAKIPFPDHHHFTDSEAAALIAHAERDNALLVTTEKDHVRLGGNRGARAQLHAASQAFAVTMTMTPASLKRLDQLLDQALAKDQKS